MRDAGERLGQRERALALDRVRAICDGTSEEGVDATPDGLRGWGNTVASITTTPGTMVISGYANSVPYGASKPRNELQCIDRQQPFSGPAKPWSSCGYGTGTTYITTSSTKFCPVAGSRWEAEAALYVNGSFKQEAWAAAVAK